MIDPVSIAGLIFTATTIGSLLVLHFRKVEVPRAGYWAHPPTVYLHPGSIVSEAELAEVLDYWTKLGFEFNTGGGVVVTHSLHGRVPGGIYVTVPSQEWSEGAAGRAWWTVTGSPDLEQHAESFLEDIVDIAPITARIIRAQIVIDPGLNAEDRVTSLRHEVGHSLGFRHARARLDRKGRVVAHPRNHVMNAELRNCGKGHKGIRP